VGLKIGKNPCIKCGSSDAYHHYGDGLGGFCFSCGFKILSDARKEELGIEKWEYNDEEVMTKEKITKEEIDKIKSYTGTSGKNYEEFLMKPIKLMLVDSSIQKKLEK